MSEERIGKLHERLTRAHSARHAISQAAWEEAWRAAENEYIERAIECDPQDHEQRYLLMAAVKATRRAKRIMEHEAQTVAGLETELAFLTGEKKPAIV